MGNDSKIEERKMYNAPFLRVFDYLAKEKLMNQGQFAKFIDSESGYISLLRSGIKKVGDDYIARITAAFAEHFNDEYHLNPDYIDGKSQYMIIENVPDDEILEKINRVANPDYDLMKHRGNNEPMEPNPIDHISMLEKMFASAIEEIKSSKDKIITELEKRIKDKEKELEDKERTIKLMEQKIEVLEAMQHIDSENPLKDYPFTPGVADKTEQNSTRV